MNFVVRLDSATTSPKLISDIIQSIGVGNASATPFIESLISHVQVDLGESLVVEGITVSDITIEWLTTTMTPHPDANIPEEENSGSALLIGAFAGGVSFLLLPICVLVRHRYSTSDAPLETNTDDIVIDIESVPTLLTSLSNRKLQNAKSSSTLTEQSPQQPEVEPAKLATLLTSLSSQLQNAKSPSSLTQQSPQRQAPTTLTRFITSGTAASSSMSPRMECRDCQGDEILEAEDFDTSAHHVAVGAVCRNLQQLGKSEGFTSMKGKTSEAINERIDGRSQSKNNQQMDDLDTDDADALLRLSNFIATVIHTDVGYREPDFSFGQDKPSNCSSDAQEVMYDMPGCKHGTVSAAVKRAPHRKLPKMISGIVHSNGGCTTGPSTITHKGKCREFCSCVGCCAGGAQRSNSHHEIRIHESHIDDEIRAEAA